MCRKWVVWGVLVGTVLFGMGKETVDQDSRLSTRVSPTPVLPGSVSLRSLPCQWVQGKLSLDFEGLQSHEPVGQAYSSCGVEFGAAALALIDEDALAGAGGNFAHEPSPDTVVFWLDEGASALTMNVPSGFSNGFSFYYSAIVDPGFVRVYSEQNRGGRVLAELELPVTPQLGEGDPNGSYDHWRNIGVTFGGWQNP